MEMEKNSETRTNRYATRRRELLLDSCHSRGKSEKALLPFVHLIEGCYCNFVLPESDWKYRLLFASLDFGNDRQMIAHDGTSITAQFSS